MLRLASFLAIGAVLRASARLRRLRRVRAALRGILTAFVLGAVLAERWGMVALSLLAFVIADTTCATAEGLLRPTSEQLAALRERA